MPIVISAFKNTFCFSFLQQREARRHEQELNPHYLKSASRGRVSKEGNEYEVPPVAALDLTVPLQIPGLASSDKYLKVPSTSSKKSAKKLKKKKRSKRKGSDDDEQDDADAEDSSAPVHVVNTVIEMPDGAIISDNEESHLPQDDPHRALDIDLDM